MFAAIASPIQVQLRARLRCSNRCLSPNRMSAGDGARFAPPPEWWPAPLRAVRARLFREGGQTDSRQEGSGPEMS